MQGIGRGALSGTALAAFSLVLGACGSDDESKSNPELTKIESPVAGSVVKKPHVGAVVKTGAEASDFRVFLDNKDVTSAFKEGDGKRTAELGRSNGLRRGVNHLHVQSKDGDKEDFDTVRFVVARRAALIRSSSIREESGEAPLHATIRVRPQTAVALYVNGRRQHRKFHPEAGALVARLGAGEGLRHGKNRVRLVAFRERGQYQEVAKTVTLEPGHPVAHAGPDHTATSGSPATVGHGVRLDASDSTPAAGAGKQSPSWKITRAPKGSKAKLSTKSGAAPTLTADKPGTYHARVTARGPRGSQSRDTVKVTAGQDVPPIGAKIDTFGAGTPCSPIVIDGEVAPGTNDCKYANYAVVNRQTLKVVESAGKDRAEAINTLQGAADKYKAAGTDHIMVMTFAGGLYNLDVDKLLSTVGVKLTPTDRVRSRLGVVGAASVIGIPGAPAGSAHVRITPQNPAVRPLPERASQTGYLQKNIKTGLYGYVPGKYVEFEMNQKGQIRVGSTWYPRPVGGDDPGFTVLTLDAQTLTDYKVKFFGPYLGGVNSMEEMRKFLKDAVDRPNPPVVLINSYRAPKPREAVWYDVSRRIDEDLGGNANLFNALNGEREYQFVGVRDGFVPPPESIAGGDLKGVLAPNPLGDYEAQAGGPTGAVNTELMRLTYQDPQPFKQFSGGQKKAEGFIVDNLDLAGDDLRSNYAVNYRANWTNKASKLGGWDPSKVVSGEGFKSKCECTEQDFKDVRDVVRPEMEDVADVQTYITGLLAPLDGDLTKQYVSLQKISQQIQTQVNPPPDNSSANTMGLISNVMKLGQAAPPPASNIVAGFSALFNLGSYLARQNGDPTLANEVSAKAQDLGDEIFKRYQEARTAATTFALIIVSDRGKLRAVAGNSTKKDDWRLPNDPGVSPAVTKGSKRFFWSSLLPVAYQMIGITGGPEAGAPANARDYWCFSSLLSKLPPAGGDSPNTSRPFGNEPDSGQDRQAAGFDARGYPDLRVNALAVDTQRNPFLVPSGSWMDPLFQKATSDPDDPGLGWIKPELIWPGYFTRTGIVRHTARCPFGAKRPLVEEKKAKPKRARPATPTTPTSPTTPTTPTTPTGPTTPPDPTTPTGTAPPGPAPDGDGDQGDGD